MSKDKQQQNFVLKGGVSETVYYEEEPDYDYAYDYAYEPKRKPIVKHSFVNLLPITQTHTDIPSDFDNSINYYQENINKAKQDYERKKYQIKQKENEKKLLQREAQLLKQQQIQNQKIINAMNKKESTLTKINSNYVVKPVPYTPKVEQDLSLMKKKQQTTVNKDINYIEKIQNRADTLYGTDSEYYIKYFENLKNKPSSWIYKGAPKETQFLSSSNSLFANVPDIANAEKFFFPQGTLADMPPQKKYDLISYGHEKHYDFIENSKETNNKSEKPKLNNSILSDSAWEKARIFIQDAEQFSPIAYKPTKNDKWTIGYGHTEGVKEGDTLTKQEAEILFRQDFQKYSESLNSIIVPLSDNEKIALISLIYNIGPNAFKNSTLLKKINKGDKDGAAQEFSRWVYQKGKKLNGLIIRRKKEKDLFLTPNTK